MRRRSFKRGRYGRRSVRKSFKRRGKRYSNSYRLSRGGIRL